MSFFYLTPLPSLAAESVGNLRAIDGWHQVALSLTGFAATVTILGIHAIKPGAVAWDSKMFINLSRWFVIGALLAITLFGTAVSFLLQRAFGPHPALIAIGPLLCVVGVLVLAAMRSDDRTYK